MMCFFCFHMFRQLTVTKLSFTRIVHCPTKFRQKYPNTDSHSLILSFYSHNEQNNNKTKITICSFATKYNIILYHTA